MLALWKQAQRHRAGSRRQLQGRPAAAHPRGAAAARRPSWQPRRVLLPLQAQTRGLPEPPRGLPLPEQRRVPPPLLRTHAEGAAFISSAGKVLLAAFIVRQLKGAKQLQRDLQGDAARTTSHHAGCFAHRHFRTPNSTAVCLFCWRIQSHCRCPRVRLALLPAVLAAPVAPRCQALVQVAAARHCPLHWHCWWQVAPAGDQPLQVHGRHGASNRGR